MSIDISKLSAKELYELARQKEIEEQRQAELNEHLFKLKEQREQLLLKFQQALTGLDNEIKQLQQKRERLQADHELDLDRLDTEMEEARKQGEKAPRSSPAAAHATPTTQTAPPSKPVMPPATDLETLLEQIAELMRTREYISDSLLREKLKSMGYANQNMGRDLEQLVNDKRLIRKSGGSYVLGKK